MFDTHKLNEDGLRKTDNVRHYFSKLMSDLEAEVGYVDSREMSLVRTKLEEASFFAIRSISLQKANQA